ncbi:MAG: hypothetical protein MJZ26_05110 [Fibrobacter sp.]|nr:hypothetical protein [Fibrobacter sp.]
MRKFLNVKIALAALVLALVATTSANAELRSRSFTPEEKQNDGWSAYLGFGGGNSMIADDGTIFINLRIGIEWNPLLATGVWASFIASDVRNYNVAGTELINYNAFGAQVELTPFRMGEFSISIPINVGGGVVNIIERGDEAFSPEDYFFVADMSAQFNYRVTRMLEVSIGGGYRMFAGIEKNNLENLDFCTPFGELRFTIKE